MKQCGAHARDDKRGLKRRHAEVAPAKRIGNFAARGLVVGCERLFEIRGIDSGECGKLRHACRLARAAHVDKRLIGLLVVRDVVPNAGIIDRVGLVALCHDQCAKARVANVLVAKAQALAIDVAGAFFRGAPGQQLAMGVGHACVGLVGARVAHGSANRAPPLHGFTLGGRCAEILRIGDLGAEFPQQRAVCPVAVRRQDRLAGRHGIGLVAGADVRSRHRARCIDDQ